VLKEFSGSVLQISERLEQRVWSQRILASGYE